MVRNVFRLDERQITSLMVRAPVTSPISVSTDRHWDEKPAHHREQSDGLAFPRGACNGLDNIIGVINAKQLFAATVRGGVPDLSQNLQPAVFVPETLTGMELLQNIRASGVQLAFIIDEYGEVQSIVTLKDIMEAITSEFRAWQNRARRLGRSALWGRLVAARRPDSVPEPQGSPRTQVGAGRRRKGTLPDPQRHDDAYARPHPHHGETRRAMGRLVFRRSWIWMATDIDKVLAMKQVSRRTT